MTVLPKDRPNRLPRLGGSVLGNRLPIDMSHDENVRSGDRADTGPFKSVEWPPAPQYRPECRRRSWSSAPKFSPSENFHIPHNGYIVIYVHSHWTDSAEEECKATMDHARLGDVHQSRASPEPRLRASGLIETCPLPCEAAQRPTHVYRADARKKSKFMGPVVARANSAGPDREKCNAFRRVTRMIINAERVRTPMIATVDTGADANAIRLSVVNGMLGFDFKPRDDGEKFKGIGGHEVRSLGTIDLMVGRTCDKNAEDFVKETYLVVRDEDLPSHQILLSTEFAMKHRIYVRPPCAQCGREDC